MKIKKTIVDKINNPQSRMRIAQDIGVGDQAIYVLLSSNSNNGRLTKMDALLAISKECGVGVLEILEDSKQDKIAVNSTGV